MIIIYTIKHYVLKNLIYQIQFKLTHLITQQIPKNYDFYHNSAILSYLNMFYLY